MYGWPVCEPACPKAVGQPTPLLGKQPVIGGGSQGGIWDDNGIFT